jgi:hypothetical protein
MNVNAWNRAVEAEMRKVGGVLLRANNHKVYRLPDGRKVNVDCTPGDRRAIKNLRVWLDDATQKWTTAVRARKVTR